MFTRKVAVLVSMVACWVAVSAGLHARTYTVDATSGSWATSSDVLTDHGPFASLPRLAVPAAAMGLGPMDVVDALSDGLDPVFPIETVDGEAELDPKHQVILFSVRRSSSGAPGTGVRSERTADSGLPIGGSPLGQSSDIFRWEGILGMNDLAPAPLGWHGDDGDESRTRLRIPSAGNPGDNVESLELRGFRAFPGPAGGPPVLSQVVFFSLAAGSPSLVALGATPSDVLVVGGSFGNVPVVFLAATTLGLPPQNSDLDSLSLEVGLDASGNLVAQQARFTVNSTALGFAVGGVLVNSGAMMLYYDGSMTTVAHTPADLGLLVTDDIDGQDCILIEENMGGVDDGVILDDGMALDALGEARVEAAPGGLVVSRFGVTGLDGLSIKTNGAYVEDGVSVSLDGLSLISHDPMLSPAIEITGYFHRPIKMLTAPQMSAWLGQVEADTMGFQVDWGGAASEVHIEAYSDGTPGGSAVVAAGELARFEGHARLEGTQVGSEGFRLDFVEEISCVDPVTGALITGDEFRFLHHSSEYSDADLTRIDIRGIDLDPIRILVNLIHRLDFFRRADADGSGEVDMSDSILTLAVLFLGRGRLDCLDAADSNDDGAVDITDSINTMAFLFLGTGRVLPPGPYVCGPDLTPDKLACGSHDPCP